MPRGLIRALTHTAAESGIFFPVSLELEPPDMNMTHSLAAYACLWMHQLHSIASRFATHAQRDDRAKEHPGT